MHLVVNNHSYNHRSNETFHLRSIFKHSNCSCGTPSDNEFLSNAKNKQREREESKENGVSHTKKQMERKRRMYWESRCVQKAVLKEENGMAHSRQATNQNAFRNFEELFNKNS